MTTTNFTTVIDNTSTAGFRNWVNDLVAAFTAVGLVQTADTGQINTTSVTLPAANTVGGYQIWRFADSSLFMKWEYGTGSANVPQMFVTIGTGSNGSGTLTGQLSTRNLITGNGTAVPVSTAVAYSSYVCHVADAFSLIWKARALTVSGVSNLPLGFVVVGKTVDATGAGTTEGFGVLRLGNQGGNYAGFLQSVRIVATAAAFGDTTVNLFVPGNASSSLVGSNNQAYLMWLNTPAVSPFKWACGIINSEIASLSTMSVAIVGSTPDTYIAIGQPCNLGLLPGIYAPTTYGYAFIYE